jgi:hypothetical protein
MPWNGVPPPGWAQGVQPGALIQLAERRCRRWPRPVRRLPAVIEAAQGATDTNAKKEPHMSRPAANREGNARRAREPQSLQRLPEWGGVLFFAERAEALAWVEAVLTGRRQRRAGEDRSARIDGE